MRPRLDRERVRPVLRSLALVLVDLLIVLALGYLPRLFFWRILTTSAALQLRNDQTRFLTGTDAVEVTTDHLERAKQLIEHSYAFVGVVERFAECHRALADRFGWTDRGYDHLNPGDRSDCALLPAGAEKL